MTWLRNLIRRLFVPLPPVEADLRHEEVKEAERHSVEVAVRLDLLRDEVKLKRRGQ